MSVPETAARPALKSSPVRRLAAAVLVSALVFAVLWIMAFGMITSLVIGAGCCVIIVTASSALDVIGVLLDAVMTALFGIIAVIAAIFAALFSLFSF